MLNGIYAGGWPRAIGCSECDPILPRSHFESGLTFDFRLSGIKEVEASWLTRLGLVLPIMLYSLIGKPLFSNWSSHKQYSGAAVTSISSDKQISTTFFRDAKHLSTKLLRGALLSSIARKHMRKFRFSGKRTRDFNVVL